MEASSQTGVFLDWCHEDIGKGMYGDGKGLAPDEMHKKLHEYGVRFQN